MAAGMGQVGKDVAGAATVICRNGQDSPREAKPVSCRRRGGNPCAVRIQAAQP